MIFGKYQLLEILGRGGMAEVFKAKSYGVEGFEKLLVIKRILPTLTDNSHFVDMFINEAKIAVSLNHANIVQVFDLGKVGDSYYIAMEFVQGMDLSDVIKRAVEKGSAIPQELAAYMTSEIAKGLDYAHRRRGQNLEPLNIIHRDISPHNVLVSYEGEVKITDFGIAKAKTTIKEETPGTVKGKYAYMAPEQALAKPHDRRVDIFSTGVVLYEALTGMNPFRGLKAADVIHKTKTRSYPAITETEFGAGAATEICDIASRALRANPADRFADAGEMYESLISFLYNIGARVGAHSVSDFLLALRDPQTSRTGSVEDHDLLAVMGAGTAATSASRSSILTGTGIQTGDDISDVTSVQVPTQQTSTETTTTGTNSLSAELREVTMVAVEMIGPPPPAAILSTLRSVLEEGGGCVVEERNDILVSIFGLEAADGRDTQDAISAALKLPRALLMADPNGTKHQVGIGVFPDRIVINSDGSPREDDDYFRAIQATRNLAKRGVGWVCTSAAAKSLASTWFRFEEVTTTDILGQEQEIFKVTGHRPVAETYGRLVGRRDELRKIGEILALVSRGSGRVLTVVGHAGTGKSRILHEVQRRLMAGGHAVGWHEATCVPWRHATPYSAVATMFRSILAVGEIESENELRGKIERLRELGLIPEEIHAVSVLLGASAAGEVGPDERGRQLRSALIRASSSLASDQMTVMFWDDLNFVDPESLDILHHLARSIGQVPLLMAFGLRPGLEHGWEEDPIQDNIDLGPLSESESKRLALYRLNVKKSPDDLLMDVALKSDGNPLYIEEYIKALIANGVVTTNAGVVTYDPDGTLVDLPKTLRGLVSARIKRLPVDQRGMIQRAAVMGQRFNTNLLARVTGVSGPDLKPILLSLKELGLLVRISASEFSFASDLVRDVVYQGIVLSDRKEIHSSIASAIEETFADRIDEFVERLATHYREAGDRSKAVDYLLRAGDKVAAEYSHRLALDYYLKALDLLHNVPRPDMVRILAVYHHVGEMCMKLNMIPLGIEKMRLAEELAEELNDKRAMVHILRITAELQVRADHFAESQQYFSHAITLADELKDDELRCEVRATAGDVFMLMGDMKNAEPYYREVIDIIELTGAGSTDLQIACTAQLAKSLANSGQPDAAHDLIKKTVATADSASLSPETRCVLYRAHAQVHYMNRDVEHSAELSLKALEIAREYDLKEQIAANAHNLGDDYVALGDFRKAFSFLRMSQEVAEEIGLDMVTNLNLIFLSFIDALKFGSNEGLSQLEQALEAANERNTVWEQVQVHYFLGRIQFERKKYKQSRDHLEQCVRIGRAAENRIYEVQANDLIEQLDELAD